MQMIDVAFRARATGADLGLRIRLDGQLRQDIVLSTDAQEFCFELTDESAHHRLEIEMYGKLLEHTKLDAQGQILEDRVIELDNIRLDGIVLGQLFFDKAVYHHDFNGTADATPDRFFGCMGCNGVLVFEFDSPLYLWLLENM